MAKELTYTCKHCGRKFRNPVKAKLHEIKELAFRNPDPIYSIHVFIKPMYDNRTSVENLVSIGFERENTALNSKGQHVMMDYNEYDDVRQVLNERASYKLFTCEFGVWERRGGNVGDLSKLSWDKMFERKKMNEYFEFTLHFKDWGEVPSYLEQLRAFIPSDGLYDKYREYFSKAIDEDMRRQVDDLVSQTMEALAGFRWSFGNSGNRVRLPRRPRMSYGLQDLCDMSLEITCHDRFNSDSDSDELFKIGDGALEKDVMHVCYACKKKFKNKEDLDRHFKEEHFAERVFTLSTHFNEWCLKDTCDEVSYDGFWGIYANDIYCKTTGRKDDGVYLCDADGNVTRLYGDYGFVPSKAINSVFLDDYDCENHGYKKVDETTSVEKVGDDASADTYVVFKDRSDLPTAFGELAKAMRPCAMKGIDDKLARHVKGFETMKEVLSEKQCAIIDGMKGQLDGIRSLTDEGYVVEVYADDGIGYSCKVGTNKLNIDEKKEDLFHDWACAPTDSIIGKVYEIEQRGVAKKKEKQASKKHGKDELFLMHMALDGSEHLTCIQVINGTQYDSLIRKLEEKDAKCNFMYDDDGGYTSSEIKSHTTFKPVTSEQYKVLAELGLVNVGRIDYDAIMEGFELDGQ